MQGHQFFAKVFGITIDGSRSIPATISHDVTDKGKGLAIDKGKHLFAARGRGVGRGRGVNSQPTQTHRRPSPFGDIIFSSQGSSNINPIKSRSQPEEFACNHTENHHHSSHNHDINKEGINNQDQQNGEEELKLDGEFVVPENNAFGHSFRDYDKESERRAIVEDFYRKNHIYQTFEFAKKKKENYGKLDKAVMSIWECCELLNEYVDESDPDLDEPQIEHLLQTAEAIKRDYPNEDWLHLTALIHDLGKVLLHPAFGEEPQWCVVGDTFPLGCAFNESTVHHQFFKENPDYENPNFNTNLGIYTENCGLDNVTMSWGHDEYMYLVAKGNNTTLPPAGLFIIRFHSFYALHRAGAYTYLMNDEDKEMHKWLQVFNKYDLYSKSKVRINQEEVKPYYLSLIEKYFPAKLRW